MDILSVLQYTFGKVLETFLHNWWLLLISIVISVVLKLYGTRMPSHAGESLALSSTHAELGLFC